MSFDIELVFAAGERRIACRIESGAALVAVTGPSGAGKTTLLNCIAGLHRPLAGHIRVGGTTLFEAAKGIDLPPERRRAGYVFQDLRLFPHRTVTGNLDYGARLAGREAPLMSRDDALGFLGVAQLARRYPTTLSGGEAKRVAIGRALLAAPRFLLLDEPLTSLDPARAEDILGLIERIRDELKLPILLVSHAAAEVERLAGHIVELDQAN